MDKSNHTFKILYKCAKAAEKNQFLHTAQFLKIKFKNQTPKRIENEKKLVKLTNKQRSTNYTPPSKNTRQK